MRTHTLFCWLAFANLMVTTSSALSCGTDPGAVRILSNDFDSLRIVAAAALECATNDSISAAFLDVRLGRETSESVADILVERDVPFVFYTGQVLPDQFRAKHPDAQVLPKPSMQDSFVQAMLQALKR